MTTTNITAKFYIGADSSDNPDPQNSELSVSEYVALQWLQVPKLMTHGDTGVSQNVVSAPTWDDELVPQQKGQATGNTADLQFLLEDTDSAGMVALKAAASITDQNNYATKILWSNGAVEFNRGFILAPAYPKGGPEEFRTATFQIVLSQEPVFDTESV